MLKIQDEFYYVELKDNKFLFQTEKAAINWLVESHKRLAGVKVYKINTATWTVSEVPDQWWIQVLAEVIRKDK